jgi:flagellar basal body rod protein FlgG
MLRTGDVERASALMAAARSSADSTTTVIRPLYPLALADFANPDGLGQFSGDVYAESEISGPPRVSGPGESGLGNVNPGTLEMSNLDLAQEFNRTMSSPHDPDAECL